MITALVGAITGLIGGVVPEILKEVRDTRAQTREMEFLRLQHQLQMEREKAGAENKMREAEALSAAADVEAFKAAVIAAMENRAPPVGIPWIDGFNAIIRPATAMLMVILFAWTSVVFLGGVMDAWAAGKIANEVKLAEVVWGSLLGEAILATLGYLFGYRSVAKRKA